MKKIQYDTVGLCKYNVDVLFNTRYIDASYLYKLSLYLTSVSNKIVCLDV